MKSIYRSRIIRLILITLIVPVGIIKAGNPDRAGQAGATELLINPWARSSGWNGANSGGIRGLEAQFYNVAGTAFTTKTEILFSHSNYLQGSGMSINAFGVSQKVGEAGVLGLSLMSLSFGDIEVTTTELPEGGLGKYTPQFINLGISYAKTFSNSIYGGFNLKIISESISNVNASGIAIDAGIQYVTGTNEDANNIKFGIALKNVGTSLKFSGDGLSTRVQAPATNNNYQMTIEQRASGFEMPSLLNIGASYDFDLAIEHKLTVAATFTSNSFTNDMFIGGLEYRFKNIFMLRGGFAYEKDIFDDALRATVFTGPSAGATVDVPLGKTGKSFGIDYSFRATNPWDGVHSFGIRFTL
jgi:hypothetical protein